MKIDLNFLFAGALLSAFFLGGSTMKLLATKESLSGLGWFNLATTVVNVAGSYWAVNQKK